MNEIANTWSLVPIDAAQHELAQARAALGFLPHADAAIASLDRLGALLIAPCCFNPPTAPTVSAVAQGDAHDADEQEQLPYVVKHILAFAGQSQSFVTAPHLSAQQAIDLAAWIQANCHSAPASRDAHPDDTAADRFAGAMKAKLATKRSEGRGGWENKEQCAASFLSELLRRHVDKGDPVDVGTLAMMLHQRGDRITPYKDVRLRRSKKP